MHTKKACLVVLGHRACVLLTHLQGAAIKGLHHLSKFQLPPSQMIM